MADGSSTRDVLGLTAQIVSAHVSNNTVEVDELPSLIEQVYHALAGAGEDLESTPAQAASRGSSSREITPREITPREAAPRDATLREAAPRTPARAEPAVPIARSVFNEYVICLECGKKQKMLKRHLQTAYGMSPDQYRAKWDLGPEYPMVAPDYARTRSNLAKAIGLGTRPREGRRV